MPSETPPFARRRGENRHIASALPLTLECSAARTRNGTGGAGDAGVRARHGECFVTVLTRRTS
jgi:hypothetical protein